MGARGSVGPRGATGEKGDSGVAGARGIDGRSSTGRPGIIHFHLMYSKQLAIHCVVV